MTITRSCAEPSAQTSAARDEGAAKVMSVRGFTVLQVLFATLLYSPGLLASLDVLSSVDIATFFATASIWTFIVAGLGLYLLSLLLPFACLLWVMGIKLFLGGDMKSKYPLILDLDYLDNAAYDAILSAFQNQYGGAILDARVICRPFVLNQYCPPYCSGANFRPRHRSGR